MLNLLDSIQAQCPELEAGLIARHFDNLSATYFERYATNEIARHLRLMAGLHGGQPVEVEVRRLAAQVFEVLVVGMDQPGTLACITAALTAHGFDFEDVHVASYPETEPSGDGSPTPRYFITVLRVSGILRGQSPAEWEKELRERLLQAFAHLADGNLGKAQSVAVRMETSATDVTSQTKHREGSSTGRFAGYEGVLLGGDFRLERKLATGGMSEVYLATQVSLNRTVAVKLFPHKGSADDELLARFNQEVAVLAQFNCAHVVPIYAAGNDREPAGGDLSWMAMEYMAGGDLAAWLHQERPPMDLATRWLRQALEGLHYAHQRSILHRDLKPHNLLLTAERVLKVSDFGLLKQVEAAAGDLTPQQVILGTPHYMSPEQALGELLDERSDIFSLGSAFFHVLSGRLPFAKSSPTAVLVQIAQEEAPSLLEVAPQVPRPLAVLVERMMARRREDRYQGIGVLLEDLASYERRGLLKCADTAPLAAAQPPIVPRLSTTVETSAYWPPMEEASLEDG